MDSEQAETRCASLYKPIGEATDVARCERWADHPGVHRGFDWQDVAYQWPEDPVEDRQTLRDFTVFRQQPKTAVEQWKDRCLEAERVRDQHCSSWRQAVQQRNTEARNAETLIRHLQTMQRERDEARTDRADAFNQMEELKQQVACQADTIRKLTRRAEA